MSRGGEFDRLRQKLPASQLTSKQLETLFKESGCVERAFFPPQIPSCPDFGSDFKGKSAAGGAYGEEAKNPPRAGAGGAIDTPSGNAPRQESMALGEGNKSK